MPPRPLQLYTSEALGAKTPIKFQKWDGQGNGVLDRAIISLQQDFPLPRSNLPLPASPGPARSVQWGKVPKDLKASIHRQGTRAGGRINRTCHVYAGFFSLLGAKSPEMIGHFSPSAKIWVQNHRLAGRPLKPFKLEPFNRGPVYREALWMASCLHPLRRPAGLSWVKAKGLK